MKIGVISDTHIPARADALPAKLIEALGGMDMIIHVGDFVEPSVLTQLKAMAPQVRAVCGNMDPDPLRKKLPEKDILQVGKFRIGIKHGFGPPDKLVDLLREAFKNDNVDMIVFGHSHAPMNEKFGLIWFFNPGSPTDDVFAPYKSFGIIEIGDTIEARIVKLL